MTADASDDSSSARPRKSRAWVVKPGRMPVTEATYDKAGAASPFGDDITFPVPADRLTYEHPPAE
jgi:hypothetical protein